MNTNISLLTEHQTAICIAVSVAALRKWRALGRGPVYIKVGRLVRYRREDIEAWLSSCPRGGEAGRAQ